MSLSPGSFDAFCLLRVGGQRGRLVSSSATNRLLINDLVEILAHTVANAIPQRVVMPSVRRL